MTAKEFIELVKQKGSFMRPEDLESLVSFYEARLRKASDAHEEEKLVEGFGDLDSVMSRVRSEYEKLRVETEENINESKSDATIREDDQRKSEPQEKSDFTEQKIASEPVEKKEDDVKVFQSPPPPSKKDPTVGKADDRSNPQKTYPGIANLLLDRMQLKGAQRKTGKIALSILFSPVFILLGILLLCLFAAAMLGIAICALFMLALEAGFILVAVVEIVYALISFFTSIPVALIELGLGTVLISLVVAVTALVYQLFIGILPSAVKKVNSLRKRTFSFFFALFYGRKGGKK